MLDSTITADFSGIGAQAGTTDWRVTGQWATRKPEERYQSLDDMLMQMDARTERSTTIDVALNDIFPTLSHEGKIGFDVNGLLLEPTNYAFQQLCQAVELPSGLLTKRLSGDQELVVRNLRTGFRTCDEPTKKVQLLRSGNELRGVTSPNYGRIWDREIIRAVKQITERSGARWQVPVAFAMPGQVRYSYVPTIEETTLYASDRDFFIFLVDQENPIQAGWITDRETGERKPDMYSRGFYAWNGECGGVSNGAATFLYRWACSNRSIREQKGFQRVSINHTKNAGEAFANKLLPPLTEFINGSSIGLADSLTAEKARKIARTDDDRMTLFADTMDFGPEAAKAITQKCIDEEGHPVETVYDAVQALTAWARGLSFQADRVMVERKTEKLLKYAMA